MNKEQTLEDDEPMFFGGEQPKIFRRPTLADAETGETHASSGSSSELGYRSDHLREDNSAVNSEGEDHSFPRSTAKQVRFQSVHSDEGWDNDYSSYSYSSEQFSSGSEDDTMAGAVHSDPDVSSVILATLPHSWTPTPDNLSLVKWSDPLKAIRQAAYRSFHATVEDYESSISSGEDETLDDPSHFFAADRYDDPHVPDRKASHVSEADSRRGSQDSLGDSDSSSAVGSDDIRSRKEQGKTEGSLIEQTKESKLATKNTTEQDLKQVVKDEIAAALKLNDDEVESRFQKRHEEAMRTKLTHFGFQENQIQAMLHPEQPPPPGFHQTPGTTPQNPVRIATQPIFLKIRREHLDVETLHYYDIPYEYDADPNYIIVLREMSEKETEILFEHTRRLRATHRDHSFKGADGRDRRGKKEYAFVRRKPRSSSRSEGHRPVRNVTLGDMFFGDDVPRTENVTPSSSKTRSKSRKPSTKDRSYVRNQSRDRDSVSSDISDAKKRDDSLDFMSERFNVDLRVPPFLAWPTTLEECDVRSTSEHEGERPSGVASDEGLRIKLTLLAIKSRIYKVDDQHTHRTQASDLVIYKSGATIVRIPRSSCPKKMLGEVNLSSILAVNSELKNDPTSLHKELAYLQGQKAKANAATKLEQAVASSTSITSTIRVQTTAPARRVISWQMAKLCMEENALVSTLRELISQFVPEFFDHTLILRCWGSLETMRKVCCLFISYAACGFQRILYGH